MAPLNKSASWPSITICPSSSSRTSPVGFSQPDPGQRSGTLDICHDIPAVGCLVQKIAPIIVGVPVDVAPVADSGLSPVIAGKQADSFTRRGRNNQAIEVDHTFEQLGLRYRLSG